MLSSGTKQRRRISEKRRNVARSLHVCVLIQILMMTDTLSCNTSMCMWACLRANMGSVHDKAVNHVIQQSHMTSVTSNPPPPSCFTASTVAAMMEHAQLLPLSLANPWALTLIYQLTDSSFDQPGATLGQSKIYEPATAVTFLPLRVPAVPTGCSCIHMKHHVPQQPRLPNRVSQMSTHTCLQMFPPKLTCSDLICISGGLLPRLDGGIQGDGRMRWED